MIKEVNKPRKLPHKSFVIKGLNIELDFLYEDYKQVKNLKKMEILLLITSNRLPKIFLN